MTRQIKRYEFVLEALQPIAHHEGNDGNLASLMRKTVRTREGLVRVPYITGDTMRHGMREAVAYALLGAAGLLGDKLSEGALRLLFAGGTMSGKGDGGTVRLDQYRELVDMIPSLALFGGALENRVVPGRLTVEDADLICWQTDRLIPSWALDYAKEWGGIYDETDHVEEAQRVRMDPMLSPEKRKLLVPGDREAVEGRLIASETASAEGDAVAREATKSTMMPRAHERVIQGSLFSWATEAIVWDDLELDTFNVAVTAFLAAPVVGGKRSTGHGRMRVAKAQDIHVKPLHEGGVDVDTTALAKGVGGAFREHVAARSDKIRTFLAGVDA